MFKYEMVLIDFVLLEHCRKEMVLIDFDLFNVNAIFLHQFRNNCMMLNSPLDHTEIYNIEMQHPQLQV
jgi:hypothetical protein